MRHLLGILVAALFLLSIWGCEERLGSPPPKIQGTSVDARPGTKAPRSEEHTSELQSQSNLVCRLLLEKKKYHYMRLILVSLAIGPLVFRESLHHATLSASRWCARAVLCLVAGLTFVIAVSSTSLTPAV